jgi:hypothetical protein
MPRVVYCFRRWVIARNSYRRARNSPLFYIMTAILKLTRLDNISAKTRRFVGVGPSNPRPQRSRLLPVRKRLDSISCLEENELYTRSYGGQG